MTPVELRMTLRARGYLLVAAVKNIGVAYYMIAHPVEFRSPSFDQIVSVFTLPTWGFAFLVSGAVCAVAAACGTEWLARVGLITSAMFAATWAGGLAMAYVSGNASSPLGYLIWGALAAKDLIVCADPLRTPFEAFTRMVRETGA